MATRKPASCERIVILMARLMTPGRSIFTANRRIAAMGAIDPRTGGDIKGFDAIATGDYIVVSRNKRRPSIRLPSRFYFIILVHHGWRCFYRGHTHHGHNSLLEPMQPVRYTRPSTTLSRSVYTILQRPPLCLSCLVPATTVYLSRCPDIRFQRSGEREKKREGEKETCMYTVVTFFISGSPLRGKSTVNRLNGTRHLLLRSSSGLL